MESKRTKGRPPRLTDEQRAAADQRLERLRKIMGHFSELKPGTISQAAGLPINAFGYYLADKKSVSYRQVMPEALDKLEAVLNKYDSAFLQK